jgi:hypothetical protein
MTAITHIAGLDVTWHGEQGPHLRQRCAWCGATLIDMQLARTSVLIVPGLDTQTPTVWPIGALITVDGNASAVLMIAAGQPLPDNSCARIDPEVTT